MMRHCLPLFLAVLILSGCGHNLRLPWEDAPPPKSQAPSVVFSLNGEPLTGGPLGQMACTEALARWFERVNANHDSGIDRRELLDDAKTQFARMDLDHDGFITADELTIFREAYRPSAAAQRARTDETRPESERKGGGEQHPQHQHHGPGGGGGGPGPGGPGGGNRGPGGGSSAKTLAAGISDPVMSADKNLDFKVSLAEFLAQAEENFARLDTDHNGRLSWNEIEAQGCPKTGDGGSR